MKTEHSYIRTIRYAVQLWFIGLSLYLGLQFYKFVMQFDAPKVDLDKLLPRPDGVDAFLPIGGLMATKFFAFTGIVDPAHPAGMFAFVAALTASAFAKKGFCGWVCPVGAISEYLWKIGDFIKGGRETRIPKWWDLGLRTIKYLLMTAFLLAILVMPTAFVFLFMIGDYYKTVDVRMLLFFTDMSTVAAVVMVALAVLSLVYKNFWCRYLCPYGALCGLLSYLSPFKVRRSEEHCTHCKACTKSCPALIDVEKLEVVTSEECFGCLTCVSHCPSKGALQMTSKFRKTVRPLTRLWIYPVIVLALFYLVIGVGMATGKWKSQMDVGHYAKLVPGLLHPEAAGTTTEAKPDLGKDKK